MHGGSGSTQEEIKLAVKNGVIKMNLDTDTQWAYWQGIFDNINSVLENQFLYNGDALFEFCLIFRTPRSL